MVLVMHWLAWTFPYSCIIQYFPAMFMNGIAWNFHDQTMLHVLIQLHIDRISLDPGRIKLLYALKLQYCD